MDKKEFNRLFKDLISHLYDYTVLETHPLVGMVNPPVEYRGTRGEYIRQIVENEIEYFRPEGKEHSFHAVEWRPYNILHQRYVKGISLRKLSETLALSERQLRRDNSRALQALAERTWDKLTSLTTETEGENQQGFDSNLEVLDLGSILSGIRQLLKNRIESEGHKLILETSSDPILVMADRIVARQILISLVSYFLNFPCEPEIQLETRVENGTVQVILSANLTGTWTQEDEKDHPDFLESTYHWSQKIHAQIQESHPQLNTTGRIKVVFSLPLGKQNLILVVDDQEPTHQMFHRFLSQTRFQIVGITDPEETLLMAKQLKPTLITLDVMMPKVDGWELLQSLQADTTTKDIPILVCSAWEEPELAKSLGAAGFLKKPVRQRDLLAALDHLGL